MKAVRRFDPSKEELEKLYQFYSCKIIGDKFGVCQEIVRRRLIEHGITVLKRGGRRAFDPPKDVLYEMYQTKSMQKIAEEFGVGETVVFKRLKEHGIELEGHKNHRLKVGRVFSEDHKKNLSASLRARATYGEKNPNWKGGVAITNHMARLGYEAREWKKKSRERAGNRCEVCGVKDGDTCGCCGTKVKLHVHHIKSFSKFPESRFDPENSKVLCPKCHYAEHQMKIG